MVAARREMGRIEEGINLTDEIIVCRQSVLSKAIADAVGSIIAERNQVANVCQQALDVARERSGVLLVVHDQNTLLRTALMRLLDDTQHAKHNCGDSPDDCPVAFARMVLRGPVRQ